MKNKLTASDLALYLGQECKVFLAEGFQAKTSLNRIPLTHVDFGGNLLEIIDIKPILRPLSDLTEGELHEIKAIYGLGDDQSILECDTFYASYLTAAKGLPKVWRYLLSIGIDLFGWIHAGLAIDKTEMSAV